MEVCLRALLVPVFINTCLMRPIVKFQFLLSMCVTLTHSGHAHSTPPPACSTVSANARMAHWSTVWCHSAAEQNTQASGFAENK